MGAASSPWKESYYYQFPKHSKKFPSVPGRHLMSINTDYSDEPLAGIITFSLMILRGICWVSWGKNTKRERVLEIATP
jgi:hypothetical protein